MTVGFGNALGTFAGMTRRQVHAALAQRIPGLDLDKGSTSGHREMTERAMRRVVEMGERNAHSVDNEGEQPVLTPATATPTPAASTGPFALAMQPGSGM